MKQIISSFALAACVLFTQGAVSEACYPQSHNEGPILGEYIGPYNYEVVRQEQKPCPFCGELVYVGKPHCCLVFDPTPRIDLDAFYTYQYTACPECGSPVDLVHDPEKPGNVLWRCKRNGFHHGVFVF